MNTEDSAKTNAEVEASADRQVFERRNGILYADNGKVPYSGIRKSFFHNGQQRDEIHYRNGKIHGKKTEWQDNGNKSLEVNFLNGIKHGFAYRWYKDGKCAVAINFKDGVKHGPMINLYHDGTIRSVHLYEEGKRTKLWVPSSTIDQ